MVLRSVFRPLKVAVSIRSKAGLPSGRGVPLPWTGHRLPRPTVTGSATTVCCGTSARETRSGGEGGRGQVVGVAGEDRRDTGQGLGAVAAKRRGLGGEEGRRRHTPRQEDDGEQQHRGQG